MSFVSKALASKCSLSLHAAAGLLCLTVACGSGSGPAPATPDPDGGSTSGSASTGSLGIGASDAGSSDANTDDAGPTSPGSSGSSSGGTTDSGAFDGSLIDGGDGGAGDGATTPDGGLDPNVAPGGNFDLSVWELEEPVGAPGAPTTIAPSQLEGASGFHDNYFFTDPTDGSMTFWDPENGVSTASSSYPRSELREMTTAGVAASWTTSGTNALSATLKVTQIPDHVAVGEIHPATGTPSTKPLLALFYDATGAISVAIDKTPAGGDVPVLVGYVPLGTRWSYVLALSGKTIRVSIDGGVAQTFAVPKRFLRESMYFEAGDDDQSAGSSSTVGAKVQFYALQVVHGP